MPRRYWTRFSAWVLGASWLLGARSAQAYRPFDGTDADVAAIGEFELELGALHYHQEGPEKLIQSPMVLNLGIVPRVELGADIASNVPLAPSGGPRFQLTDTDVFIKILLRSGILQAETGPSIAVETGPMFPELNGQTGLGAWVNLIASERWSWLFLHLDNEASVSRGELNFGWRTGLIGEARLEAPVRPVAELSFEHETNPSLNTYTALAGIIWSAADGLEIDAAGIVASVAGERAFEARLGITWALPMWTPAGERPLAAGGTAAR